jgi:hypothetical protein
MNLRSTIALLSISLLFGGCFTEKDEDIVHHDFNEDHAVLPVEEEIIVDTKQIWLSEQATKIDLDSISITLDSLEFYVDSVKSDKDTSFIYLELGSSLANHYFQVNSSIDSSSMQVIYQFETSLTVSDEGPHCDLLNWMHYSSYADTLEKLDSTGVYQFKNCFEDSLSSAFPDVSMNDVRKAVKEHCGEHWMERSEKAETIADYPFSVSISREIIRIQILNSKEEIVREKIIIFEIPMGC